MTVTVLNHAVNDIEVHKPGCADVAKSHKRRLVNSEWPVTVPEGMTVAAAVVADLNDSFGWTPDDGEPPPWSEHHIKVFPCVKHA